MPCGVVKIFLYSEDLQEPVSRSLPLNLTSSHPPVQAFSEFDTDGSGVLDANDIKASRWPWLAARLMRLHACL